MRNVVTLIPPSKESVKGSNANIFGHSSIFVDIPHCFFINFYNNERPITDSLLRVQTVFLIFCTLQSLLYLSETI